MDEEASIPRTYVSGRLALLYADGSMSVLSSGATLTQAERDRAFSDEGERDSARLTKIARVDVTVLDIVEAPTAKTVETCPHCRKTVCGEELLVKAAERSDGR